MKKQTNQVLLLKWLNSRNLMTKHLINVEFISTFFFVFKLTNFFNLICIICFVVEFEPVICKEMAFPFLFLYFSTTPHLLSISQPFIWQFNYQSLSVWFFICLIPLKHFDTVDYWIEWNEEKKIQGTRFHNKRIKIAI